MQREDPEGIVILCDFCRREWNGEEAMIEGHHGSIICLECLKRGLVEQHVGAVRAGANVAAEASGTASASAAGEGGGERPDGRFSCTLCLRYNMPASMPRWTHEGSPAVVCQECMYQAARAFHKNRDVPFEWNPADYPPPVKPPRAAKEAQENA